MRAPACGDRHGGIYRDPSNVFELSTTLPNKSRTMATPSAEHLPQISDSKFDTKIEDEQVEHGSPIAAQYIETKYAGESEIGHNRQLLTNSKTWEDGGPRRSSGELRCSAPFYSGPV